MAEFDSLIPCVPQTLILQGLGDFFMRFMGKFQKRIYQAKTLVFSKFTHEFTHEVMGKFIP